MSIRLGVLLAVRLAVRLGALLAATEPRPTRPKYSYP
jgi:hypothetical protein